MESTGSLQQDASVSDMIRSSHYGTPNHQCDEDERSRNERTCLVVTPSWHRVLSESQRYSLW